MLREIARKYRLQIGGVRTHSLICTPPPSLARSYRKNSDFRHSIKTTHSAPPVALTIAGSDSSAGAGIQADLKTFAAHGVYGVNALTAIVAEVPGDVSTFSAVNSTLLHHQLKRVGSSFYLNAAKTGMLANAELVEVVAAFFTEHSGVPLVIDPVIRAGAGTELLTPEGVILLKEKLIPLARLVTPNLHEAEALLGSEIRNIAEFSAAPQRLHDRYGSNFLVKGGHFDGGDTVVDHAWIDGVKFVFSHPRLIVSDVHGTGCTLSAAITAELAGGRDLPGAIERATEYLTTCLAQHFSWPVHGDLIEALNHFPDSVVFPRS